jgi:hypothetical protein
MKSVLIYGSNQVEGEFIPCYLGCGFGTFFAYDGREFKDVSAEDIYEKPASLL